MSTWPFDPLRPLTYRCIVADPPWRFALYSERTGAARSPQAHYTCMDLNAIKALPVGQLAAGDCLLCLWATAPMLPQALEVMAAWGFTFKTMGVWAKQSKRGDKQAFGTGYILRSAAEPYLIGTVGRVRVLSHSVRNCIQAPIREHSRKPAEIYRDLEALTDGTRADLFSRESRPGWDSWGQQAGLFDAIGGVA
ncbi:MT-A70 family methyltransferase [Roseospira visakhapatnamensis]|uniref:N6-adenosine-specific RNA methylase IME4 n=1 Tax=Roseospira visakhapatnamensis TaxID=390880 RepID=A0A7W6RFX4_9PROT|nr:MT-A70 family methyltransferase [Roseospira visakhapatnamensis]MBB4267712.1 N6-adenosine-specific RNA methylase IME4 [Roseospira visakhapatnamensis]